VARGRSAPWWGLVVAVASVTAITAAIYGLREFVPVLSTGVLYLLAVLLVSSFWGLWLGLATSVASAAAFNFFHIPPTGRFRIAEGENWVALAVLLAAAVVTSTLADRARAREREADQRHREADLAAEMARLLLGGESIEVSLRAVGARIAQTFGLPSVSVEPGWLGGDERRRALPLIVDGGRVGTVLLPRVTPPAVLSAVETRVVPSLETLLAAALQRERLQTQVIETRALRRSNVLKTTLLRSVSHDLRTPLTAIATAAGGLLSETLTDEQRRELASVIADETAQLSHLVDNVLDLTRLQAGAAEPRSDWCDIEDVVRGAVASVEPPPAGFDISLDDDLPLIRADAAQLERALVNIVENCARMAGDAPVTVRGHAGGRVVTLRFSDRGPGIAKEDLERVFEPFYRSGERDGAGLGLGLAIARGFLEANGGRVRAESLPGQGTSFVVQLPVPERAAAVESEPPGRRVA
jgi:two-component system, OmpR family, sensor histidine kinase KdpD